MSIFTFQPLITVKDGADDPAIDFAKNALAKCWEAGSQAGNAFDSQITTARADLAYQSNSVLGLSVGALTSTAVIEPAVTIPASVAVSDINSSFSSQHKSLMLDLSTKFSEFQSTYFPSDASHYALASGWINSAISNPDHGIPAAVAAQLLTDVKSKAYADYSVQSDAVMATFAARRFPLPPGAAASAVMQISQKTQDSISESNRALMMKYVDNMKFAVEKSLSTRHEAMSSAIGYIGALASGSSIAGSVVGIGYDAQSKLISSAASFYQARIEARKLTNHVAQYNIDKKYEKDVKVLDLKMDYMQESVKMMLTEAQALAQIATSLFNNINVSSSVTV